MGCYPRRVNPDFIRKQPSAAVCCVESCLRQTKQKNSCCVTLTSVRKDQGDRSRPMSMPMRQCFKRNNQGGPQITRHGVRTATGQGPATPRSIHTDETGALSRARATQVALATQSERHSAARERMRVQSSSCEDTCEEFSLPPHEQRPGLRQRRRVR